MAMCQANEPYVGVLTDARSFSNGNEYPQFSLAPEPLHGHFLSHAHVGTQAGKLALRIGYFKEGIRTHMRSVFMLRFAHDNALSRRLGRRDRLRGE